MNKKILVTLLILIYALSTYAQKSIVVVDADTGNEIDDLYAIVRALVEESFDVRALISAQYHTQNGAPENTVQVSQAWNEKILTLMGLENIPHPIGSNKPLKDQKTPQVSPASEKIIEIAHSLKDGQKLEIFTLGPVTNVASAILSNPAIVPKIRLNMIGGKFNPKTQEWGYDFNCNNDTNAVYVVMNAKGLDLNIMTSTVSRDLVFSKKNVDKYLKGNRGIWDALVERWENYILNMTWTPPEPPEKLWVMWDIANLEAFIDPELATMEEVITPPKYDQRKVNVYTDIDVEGMKKDYWSAIQKYMIRQ